MLGVYGQKQERLPQQEHNFDKGVTEEDLKVHLVSISKCVSQPSDDDRSKRIVCSTNSVHRHEEEREDQFKNVHGMTSTAVHGEERASVFGHRERSDKNAATMSIVFPVQETRRQCDERQHRQKTSEDISVS